MHRSHVILDCNLDKIVNNQHKHNEALPYIMTKQGRPSPLKPMMHIESSPYSHKIYKFPPISAKFLYFPPIYIQFM